MPLLGRPTVKASDLFAVFLLCVTGYLFAQTAGWLYTTALVPRIVTGTAFVAVALSLANAVFRRCAVQMRSAAEEAQLDAGATLHMDIATDDDHLPRRVVAGRALCFGLWLVGFMVSMALIGIIPTIPLFIVGYMRLEARERWSLVLPMAAIMTFFVYFVFDRTLTINWPQTWLGQTFPAMRAIPSV